MSITTKENPFINSLRGDEGSISRSVALGSAAVMFAGGALFFGYQKLAPNIPNLDGLTSTTITPEETVIKAKTIDIVPVGFDCRAMAVYDASGSEATVKAHAFEHAARADRAKVIFTVCAKASGVEIVDGDINVGSNTVDKEVTIAMDSFVFDAQFNEADSRIIDVSNKGTSLLEGGAQAGDSIIDGLCVIVTFGNCDDGLGNPLDAAVKQSAEDQAKTEQYLRIEILKAVQEQCAANDWAQLTQAIISAYKEQAISQGASGDVVSVKFVDANGTEVNATPDFTKKVVQTLIDRGAISDAMPDVEIQKTTPVINCSSEVAPVTTTDLEPTVAYTGGNVS